MTEKSENKPVKKVMLSKEDEDKDSTEKSSMNWEKYSSLLNTYNSKFSNEHKLYKGILLNEKLSKTSWDILKKYLDDSPTYRLNSEIVKLEEKLVEDLKKVRSDKANDNETSENTEKLKETIESLHHKREIQHLLDSVTPKAHNIIEQNNEFRELFTNEEEVNAFVVSVDIRRSTELMLKARSPKLFADFITTLCGDLEDIFKNNYAVVDKFTGDGILAFFPEFFSGDDAGYLALKAAKEANEAFTERYKNFRTSFNTVLKDVGLGTGIDYGKVHQVRMAGALTIVGRPVVYACRLGGAPAGKIYINQPAYEIINDKYAHTTIINETFIEIKSEGSLICYETKLTNKQYKIAIPSWKTQTKN